MKSNLVAVGLNGKSNSGGVASVNPRTGRTNWTVPLRHRLETPPIVGADGTVYVAGTKLFALGRKI